MIHYCYKRQSGTVFKSSAKPVLVAELRAEIIGFINCDQATCEPTTTQLHRVLNQGEELPGNSEQERYKAGKAILKSIIVAFIFLDLPPPLERS
jgi:hypothetical protein